MIPPIFDIRLEQLSHEIEQAQSRIRSLENEREILLAAMGPFGTPPLPNEGTESVAPNGQVMVGGLLNDPRFP